MCGGRVTQAAHHRLDLAELLHPLIGEIEAGLQVEKGPNDGKLKVTVDGKSKTLNLHAAKSKFDQTLGTFKVKTGKNTVKLTVVSGTVAIEGYGIASRTA